MPINKDMRGASGPKPVVEVRPPISQDRISPAAVSAWWADRQAMEGFHKPMSIEDREFRASWSWARCDRMLWYFANAEPETEPSGVASHWRMAIGTAGHELLQPQLVQTLEARGEKVELEAAVDLQAIGLNGAASADVVRWNAGPAGEDRSDGRGPVLRLVPTEVVEIKTLGGYQFKMAAAPFKGGPAGPKWAHILQGALAAAALSARYQAPVALRIAYLSLELIGADLATKMGMDEAGKFVAEWVFPSAWVNTVAAEEVERVNAVLAEPFVPEPQVWDAELPTGAFVPMTVTDVERGAVAGVDADGHQQYAKTWLCGYCPFRTRCRTDGL